MSSEVGSGVIVDFPVSGDCLVLRPPGHGRWAFDVLPLDPGSGSVADGGWWRYLRCGLRARDVSGWGREARSPVDGEVLAIQGGEPDRDRLVPWWDGPAGFLVRPLLKGRDVTAMAGNHVVVRADGCSVLLAHLQQGSVQVRPGQTVRTGEVLGLIGSSGNALGPHLHLQVMDGPEPLAAKLVPFAVRHFQLWDGDRWQDRAGDPLPPRRARIRVT